MTLKVNERRSQQGFTYIDVMIAVMILMVGVLALTSALTAAVIRTREGEQQLIAKQLAYSTLESIFSARDMTRLGWNAVGNVGSNPVGGVNQGVFLVGQQAVRPNPGADGVVGTADDDPGLGADGVAGTADDPPANPPLAGYQRQIAVTDYNDPERLVADGFPIMMRRINVIIFYRVGNIQRQEAALTMITNYAVQE